MVSDGGEAENANFHFFLSKIICLSRFFARDHLKEFVIFFPQPIFEIHDIVTRQINGNSHFWWWKFDEILCFFFFNYLVKFWYFCLLIAKLFPRSFDKISNFFFVCRLTNFDFFHWRISRLFLLTPFDELRNFFSRDNLTKLVIFSLDWLSDWRNCRFFSNDSFTKIIIFSCSRLAKFVIFFATDLRNYFCDSLTKLAIYFLDRLTNFSIFVSQTIWRISRFLSRDHWRISQGCHFATISRKKPTFSGFQRLFTEKK